MGQTQGKTREGGGTKISKSKTIKAKGGNDISKSTESLSDDPKAPKGINLSNF